MGDRAVELRRHRLLNSVSLGGAGRSARRLDRFPVAPARFASGGAEQPATIPLDRRRHTHTAPCRFNKKRWHKWPAGALLWLLPMAALLATGARDAGQHAGTNGLVLHQSGTADLWGRMPVLPLRVRGAVEHFHWLTGPQMIGAGQRTGPMIMVVAFVGFLGWTKQVLKFEQPVPGRGNVW